MYGCILYLCTWYTILLGERLGFLLHFGYAILETVLCHKICHVTAVVKTLYEMFEMSVRINATKSVTPILTKHYTAQGDIKCLFFNVNRNLYLKETSLPQAGMVMTTFSFVHVQSIYWKSFIPFPITHCAYSPAVQPCSLKRSMTSNGPIWSWPGWMTCKNHVCGFPRVYGEGFPYWSFVSSTEQDSQIMHIVLKY